VPRPLQSLSARHLQCIQLLAEGTETQVSIAEQVGVRPVRVSQWKADPLFKKALDEKRREYLSRMDDLRFIHKAARLRELERMVEATPLFEDGEKGRTYLVRDRAALLDQIRKEMESLETDDGDGEDTDYGRVAFARLSALVDRLTGTRSGPVDAEFTAAGDESGGAAGSDVRLEPVGQTESAAAPGPVEGMAAPERARLRQDADGGGVGAEEGV